MAKIAYSEIEYSEKTGKDTTAHLWDWNPTTNVLVHYVDNVFVDEFIGETAKKMVSTLLK